MSVMRWTVLAVTGALTLAACATDATVTTQRADQLGGAGQPPTQTEPDEPAAPPTTAPEDTGDDETIAAPPPETVAEGVPDESVAPPSTLPPSTDAIDFGASKPERDYDDLLLATLTDVQEWWSQTYPDVYGKAYTPLQGRVYAAYPGRNDPLPGCGEPVTSYQEVQQFVAFYCGDGDFIVYDDGSDGLLANLATRFGPSTIGIVLAHEFGHAIQLRSGALARNLPTIATEQQADCFAGAWAGRAARGESPYVRFDDADVRAGLIAMLEVRDPVGTPQFVPGGHGSGFDRVNAFQVGFREGPARCAALFDDPLPLTPSRFIGPDDEASGGNAPFDELLVFIPEDLNLYWTADAPLDLAGLGDHTVVLATDADDVDCSDPVGEFSDGVVLCPSTDTVVLNEPYAVSLYRQEEFGDFSVGYILGSAWAEAVQRELGSDLGGEARALRNDCLTGAWVQSVLPVDGFLPQPRLEERQASVSPGDLDEAVRTLILLSDEAGQDDVTGTAFEKIDSFRAGVLGGLAACGV